MNAFVCSECRKRSRNFLASTLVGGRRLCDKCSAVGEILNQPGGMKACASNFKDFEFGLGKKACRSFKSFKDVEAHCEKLGWKPLGKGADMPNSAKIKRENAKAQDEKVMKDSLKWWA